MPENPFILFAIAVAAAVVTFAIATLVPAAMVKRRMKRDLADRCRGAIVLTYDDGPGLRMTPPLLEVLREHDARASFFFVGFRALRHPEVCDAIAAAGHELGNHSHWHRHAWRTWPWLAVLDLQHGMRTLQRWLSPGAPYRPPFGKLTTWTWLAARRRGCRLCFWTFDGGDTWPQMPDPREMAQRLAREGGGVVLLHSHDRGDDRQRYVLDVTRAMLKAAREHNLRICAMADLEAAIGARQA